MNRPASSARLSRRHFLRTASLVGVGVGVSTFALACGTASAPAGNPSATGAVVPTVPEGAAAPASSGASRSTVRIALPGQPTAIDALRHFTTADQNIFFNL